MTVPPRKQRNLILFSLPYLLLLFTAFSVFSESADDPFITFRYAANALVGHGPVFNVGERVEGFTSTLHLLVCMALLKIVPSVGILFKSKLTSLAFGILSLWQMRRLALRCGLTPGQAVFAQTLVALNINFALAATNALETTLYVFLILTTLLTFLNEIRGKGGAVSGALLFLCLLTRPETLLVAVCLIGVRFWRHPTENTPTTDALQWTMAFLLPALCLFSLRHWYFGQWLPNTYFAKSGPVAGSAKNGVEYLLQTLSPLRLKMRDMRQGHTSPAQMLEFIVAPVWWGLALFGLWYKRRADFAPVLGAALLATVALILRSGGDWMIGWRFAAAAVPLAAILQVKGLIAFCDWLAAKNFSSALASRPLHRSLAAALLLLWAFAFSVVPHNSWAQANFATSDGLLFACADDLGLTPITIRVGEFAKESLPSDAVIAYSEMGYGPFINPNQTFIDFRGLTDGEISHLPSRYKSYVGVEVIPSDLNHPQHPACSILARRNPDYVICICQGEMPSVLLGKYRHTRTLTAAPEANGNRRQAYVYARSSDADARTRQLTKK